MFESLCDARSIKDILLAFISQDKALYLGCLGTVLIITAFFTHIFVSRQDKAVKSKREYVTDWIKQYFTGLLGFILLIVGLAIYTIVVFILNLYPKILLEGTVFSFLELPIFCIIVFCVIMGTALAYIMVGKSLDRRRLLRDGFLTKKDLTKDEIRQFYGDEDEEKGQHNEKE